MSNLQEKDMRAARLNEAFQYIDDKFLNLVEQEKRAGRGRLGKRSHGWTVLAAAAASICVLLVLPAGVLAANWFGLRDLLLAGADREESGDDKAGLTALSDYQESPEVQASIQWAAFLAECQEGEMADSTGGVDSYFPEEWYAYRVTEQEKGEKLEEIAGQYGLMLHTWKSARTLEELETQMGGAFMEGVRAEDCQLYEDGSFILEGSADLSGCGTVGFRFQRAGKKMFNEGMVDLGNVEDYTCLKYTTAEGEPVFLARSSERALIYRDYIAWYITVEITDGAQEMTEADLQEMADRIDFTNIKYGWVGEHGYATAPGIVEISLAGYLDSAEAKAQAEWKEFLEQYDTDGKILDELGNGIFYAEGREDWFQYSVYTQEMGEKLDEIASRYGLKLHTVLDVVDPEELEYRVGGCFLPEECQGDYGYIYEDGSFQTSGEMFLVPKKLASFQLRRVVRGTFDEVALNVGDMKDYRDWQYVTADGIQVLLALGPVKGLVLADFDTCFVSVNVLMGSLDGLTGESLQKLADEIDFQVLKEVQVPDMRGDS